MEDNLKKIIIGLFSISALIFTESHGMQRPEDQRQFRRQHMRDLQIQQEKNIKQSLKKKDKRPIKKKDKFIMQR